MRVSTESLLGGALSWDRISRKQYAEESGVDPTVLSRVKNGEMGFSAKSARQAAPVAGKSAVAIFAASHAHSIHKRWQDGELDDGQVLGAVGRTFTALKDDFGQDQIDLKNDKLFTDALQVLQGLAEQAAKSGATVNQMERLGRDGSGLRAKKAAVAEEKSAPGIYGALGRIPDGTAKKMRYGS